MFEEMTEQQAREQILEMTKETGSRMHLVCTMRMRW